jgi:hypothetical protein
MFIILSIGNGIIIQSYLNKDAIIGKLQVDGQQAPFRLKTQQTKQNRMNADLL